VIRNLFIKLHQKADLEDIRADLIRAKGDLYEAINQAEAWQYKVMEMRAKVTRLQHYIDNEGDFK